MKKNQLGRTGLSVTDLCLGTMTWGRQNTESEGHAQMDYALEVGINFFDTAEMYAVPPTADTCGRTEEIIGTWFKTRGARDRVILATKAAGPGLPWVRDGSPLTPSTLTAALEASLHRLQTEYIDLYQIHWPNRPFPHFERHGAGAMDFSTIDTTQECDSMLALLRTLEGLIAQGKIRAIGLSDETAWGIMTYLALADRHGLPRMASIQNEFSLLNRVDDPYVAEVCVREDVAYLPWSPLAGGLLSGKYANGARPTGSRWQIDHRPAFRDTPAAHRAVADYHAIAQGAGIDPCQMAIAFCRQQSFVTSTIIGATSLDQLKINLGAAHVTLSADVMQEIAAVYAGNPMPF